MTDFFDCVNPMDARYYGQDKEFFKRLHPYVSEKAFIRYQLRVEAALAKCLSELGIAPETFGEEVERACAEVTPEEVYAEEARIQHNIRALVNCIRQKISAEGQPYVHLFATSNDITDTAGALRLKELCIDVVVPELLDLEGLLIEMALQNADRVQVGRTHGQHALPTTFGYVLALYVARLGGRIETIHNAATNLRGQFSGAVGAYNAVSLQDRCDPAEFERRVLGHLGLLPDDAQVSSQIVQPEFVTDLAYAVVSCFSVLADLADDMRHLQRSEIAEVRERVSKDRVGSSTMPHKVNPKDFENVKSLWKAYMPRLTTVLMDQLSEHQRDLTNSASSRFIPELITGLVYATRRLKDTLGRIEVDPEAMNRSLDASKNLIIAEPLYILLVLAGHPDGYEYSRSLARQCRETGSDPLKLIADDPESAPYLEKISPQHIEILRDPTRYIGAAGERTRAVCAVWGDRLKSLGGTKAG